MKTTHQQTHLAAAFAIMCGLSAGLFFALVNQIYAARWQPKPK